MDTTSKLKFSYIFINIYIKPSFDPCVEPEDDERLS